MSQDRPNKTELLDAVIEYLMDDLFPTLDGELAFHARVSANLLTILKRELDQGENMDTDELTRLQSLLKQDTGTLDDMTRELATKIRSGDLDDQRAQVMADVKQTIEDKLRVVSPKYLES